MGEWEWEVGGGEVDKDVEIERDNEEDNEVVWRGWGKGGRRGRDRLAINDGFLIFLFSICWNVDQWAHIGQELIAYMIYFGINSNGGRIYTLYLIINKDGCSNDEKAPKIILSHSEKCLTQSQSPHQRFEVVARWAY